MAPVIRGMSSVPPASAAWERRESDAAALTDASRRSSSPHVGAVVGPRGSTSPAAEANPWRRLDGVEEVVETHEGRPALEERVAGNRDQWVGGFVMSRQGCTRRSRLRKGERLR